ncbi:MAG TPA: methyltransferase domain-containing protein [Kofleriaceae bacterium]|nr:methyltransferase domain-containing protein [Kofleriaceae bacterium]
MIDLAGYEHRVQEFYDSALPCYERIMGDRWHHADPDALAAGLPRLRGCEILEERVVALCGLGAGDRALDFGSGIGGPTLHMARVTGASFVGVSNNDRLNAQARAKAARAGLSGRVAFLTLDDLGYKALPFPDGSFQAITFFESVCHVPDKPALFRELARVLAPGGRLGGMDWVQRPFGMYQTDAQIAQFMQPVNDAISIPAHGTVASYSALLADAGLRVAIARDLYDGVLCWSTVQDDETPAWTSYEGPEQQMFRRGEEALAHARRAGVFSIGLWVAAKPRVV